MSHNTRFLKTSTNIAAKDQKTVPIRLDYLTMNKSGLAAKALDPHLMSKYHRSNPVHVKVIESNGRGISNRLPHDKDCKFAYGMPSRVSSPVWKLMTCADEGPQCVLCNCHITICACARARRAKQSKINMTPHDFRPLKSTKLSKEDKSEDKIKNNSNKLPIALRDPKTLFKMPRFRNVACKVASWQNVK
jgi:Domain of unknown function (DUF4483)